MPTLEENAGAIDGSDILILVDISEDDSGDYVAIAGQQDLTESEERDLREVTTKVHDHKRYEYGEMDTSLSFDTLYVPDDKARSVLEDAIREGKKLSLRRTEDEEHMTEAFGLIGSLEKNYPQNDNSTFACEVQLDGPFVRLLYVETDDADNISSSSADLNGEIMSLQYDEAEVYFAYRETGEDSFTETDKQTIEDEETFTETVDSFSSGTEYEYKAVAEAEDSTDEGELVTFETS